MKRPSLAKEVKLLKAVGLSWCSQWENFGAKKSGTEWTELNALLFTFNIVI